MGWSIGIKTIVVVLFSMVRSLDMHIYLRNIKHSLELIELDLRHIKKGNLLHQEYTHTHTNLVWSGLVISSLQLATWQGGSLSLICMNIFKSSLAVVIRN